jgi:hypothetical protein
MNKKHSTAMTTMSSVSHAHARTHTHTIHTRTHAHTHTHIRVHTQSNYVLNAPLIAKTRCLIYDLIATGIDDFQYCGLAPPIRRSVAHTHTHTHTHTHIHTYFT